MNVSDVEARRITAADLNDTVLDPGSVSSWNVPVKSPPISDKYAAGLITAEIERATAASLPLRADPVSGGIFSCHTRCVRC